MRAGTGARGGVPRWAVGCGARPRRLSDPIALRCGFRSHPPELPAASLAQLLENSVPLAVAAPRSRSVGGTWRGAAVPPRHLSVPFQKAFPIPVWLRRDRPSPRAIPPLVGGRRCWKFQRGPRDNGNELGAAPGGFGDPAGAQLRARRAPGSAGLGKGDGGGGSAAGSSRLRGNQDDGCPGISERSDSVQTPSFCFRAPANFG